MQLLSLKQIRFSLILVLTCLLGCDSVPVETGVWKGDKIPDDKAKKLRQLNTDLFKAIKTDRDDAEALFSTDFLEQKNIRAQFDYVNKLRSEDEYILLTDYYIINRGFDGEGLEKIDHAEIEYVPVAKEMYLAYFIPKNKQNKLMLTVAYGKFASGWKAQHVALGNYTKQGKTTTELYEIAKEEYARGHLINAINNVILALNCVSPSRYWKQPNSEEIKAFADRIINEANSKVSYPIVLDNIKSKPAIFSISSNSKEDGLTQYVYYLTKLKLTDSAALRHENEQLKQQLPRIFPGIDKGKKTILYSAMHEKPKVGQSIPHFDIEEKIAN